MTIYLLSNNAKKIHHILIAKLLLLNSKELKYNDTNPLAPANENLLGTPMFHIPK